MQKVVTQLRAIWQWFADIRYVLLAFAVIGMALVVSLRPNTSEAIIRLTGLVLQLLGILTVAWGISETRALFGYLSLARKIRTWLTKFPLLSRKPISMTLDANVLSLTGNVRPYVRHGSGENPTVETRIEALERNITLIHERINGVYQEVDKSIRNVTDEIKHEEETRRAENLAIRERLEAAGTGGVHISAIGASWLFVGVTLSTAAPEIASLIK